MTRREALTMSGSSRDHRAACRRTTVLGYVILADTSAWVEYDSATGSPPHRRLKELIETGGRVAVTEPVIMEVLAGAPR